MKNLIFISGTMGAGKTATCRELKKLLAPCVWLDGDWCWSMDPFVVTNETKDMVTDNISHLLSNFLSCSAFQTVIFCWVMQQQAIVESLLSHLDLKNVRFSHFTLTPSPEALTARLNADIIAGLRDPDIIERSLARLPLYDAVDSIKMNVSEKSPKEVAEQIACTVESQGMEIRHKTDLI